MFERIINLIKKKPVDRIVYPLPSEIIKRDQLINELTKEKESLKGQISNYLAKNKLKKEREKEFDEEQDTIKDLRGQIKEMNEEEYCGAFSFGKFYEKLMKDKKFLIDITDRDDLVLFGEFGDFIILKNGDIGIVDKVGNVLSHGKQLNQIINKPGSLGNQLKRKKISLPCNKDMVFIPDLAEVFLPEFTLDKKAKSGEQLNWAKVSEKTLEEHLVKKEIQLHNQNEYIERIEKTKADLLRSNKQLKRENEIIKNSKKGIEVELSRNISNRKQFENKIGKLQNQITLLRKMKKLNDDMVNKLTKINDELRDKVEDMGVKSEFDKVLGTVQDLIDWSVSKLPQKVPIDDLKDSENKPKPIKKAN